MGLVIDRHEGQFLEWTSEHVTRFWDHWANSQELHEQYFSFQLGKEIVNFLSDVTDLRGRHILDYGCGPGFLVEHLLQHGARVTGADYSPESANRVNERFADEEGWEGAVQIDGGDIAVDDSQFDLITCIETIEHMFEGTREKMLLEFRRALKSGGRVMFTTPNDEDLPLSYVFCPQCGHTFHKWQHTCSWTKESLTKFLTDGGFRVEFCAGINLINWGQRKREGVRKGVIDLSLRDIVRIFRNTAFDTYRGVADQIFPRQFPNGRVFRRLLSTSTPMHLIAIASKNQ